jgi:hypothetical protein
MPLEQGATPTTVAVQLVLNDKGRVAVGDKLGGAVDKVEGMVVSQNSDSYTIAVSRVMQLGGNTSKWNGEQVTIAKEGTSGYQVYKYNQARTIVLVAAIAVGAVALLVSLGLKGGGSGSDSSGGGGGGPQTH